jgi:hypothetical protein
MNADDEIKALRTKVAELEHALRRAHHRLSRDCFPEPMPPGLHTRLVIDRDEDGERFRTHHKTFGRSLDHRGVRLTVRGCLTPQEAADALAEMAIVEGWAFREKPWEFWLPEDPRLEIAK